MVTKQKPSKKIRDLPSASLRPGLRVDFPAVVTATSLNFVGRIDYDDWKQTLFKTKQLNDGSNWWLGACLAEGEARFGEDYAQAVTEAGISPDKAMAAKYVHDRIPEGIRIKEVTWSHHRIIASLATVDIRSQWIMDSYKHHWTVLELTQQLQDAGLRKSRAARNADDDEKAPGRNMALKVCECCCGYDDATTWVCATCASVATAAAKMGMSDAIHLLTESPPKPRKAMLEWAMEYIQEPEFDNDADRKEWHAQFARVKRAVSKSATKAK